MGSDTRPSTGELSVERCTIKQMAKKKTDNQSEYERLIAKMKPAHVRFVYLYLGSEDGKCFNNATLAYIRAFDIDTVTTKVKQSNGSTDYTKEYKSAKSAAFALLTKIDIQKLRSAILLEQGYNADNIKKRFAELAGQNKNLPIALASTDRMAKIAGVLKEESKNVDIPQLTELTNVIKGILTPSK